MASAQSDLLAQQAAGLFVAGKAATVAEAIRLAMGAADAPAREAPSHGRVRKHIRGMSMQAMGEAAYRSSIRAVLETAEQMMTVLEESSLDVRTLLMGRAARGELDGEFRVHIRLSTRTGIDRIASLLETAGYVDQRIETVNTRYGRLNRIVVTEDEVEFVLTRCPPDMRIDRGRGLFGDRKVEAIALSQLLRRIEEMAGGKSADERS